MTSARCRAPEFSAPHTYSPRQIAIGETTRENANGGTPLNSRASTLHAGTHKHMNYTKHTIIQIHRPPRCGSHLQSARPCFLLPHFPQSRRLSPSPWQRQRAIHPLCACPRPPRAPACHCSSLTIGIVCACVCVWLAKGDCVCVFVCVWGGGF